LGIANAGPSYTLDVSGIIHATSKIIVDSSNTAYLRGGDDAELWDINVANTMGIYGVQNSAVGAIKLGSGGGTIYGTSNFIGIGTTSPSYTLHVVGDEYIVSGSLGVNVAPNATDGRVDASNDIVAFSSDKRLKTNIKLLESPITKLNKLTGFTYNWNEKANELAKYDMEQSYVGVFAQDVQSILPEAVKLAPFDNDGNDNSISGENYLTVQYEKIVPLLIEGIKEQQIQINQLKEELNKLKNGNNI
jgi:hypothetical protein